MDSDVAARIAALEANIKARAQRLQGLVLDPPRPPSADFTLRVRRLASRMWRDSRPLEATADELAEWDRRHPTTYFFRAALQELGTLPSNALDPRRAGLRRPPTTGSAVGLR